MPSSRPSNLSTTRFLLPLHAVLAPFDMARQTDASLLPANDTLDVVDAFAATFHTLLRELPTVAAPPPLKACGCGRVYATRAEWEALAFVHTYVDEVEKQEWRNCVCGSTIAIVTEEFTS